MRCATCNEHIDEYQDTRTCEICGKTMHALCAVDRQSPLEEYLRTIYPSRMTAHPTTYCYFCYEIETLMVRWAMLGQTLSIIPGVEHAPAVAKVNAEWAQQYAEILDAWPREPKPKPEISDEECVDQMVTEIRKAG